MKMYPREEFLNQILAKDPKDLTEAEKENLYIWVNQNYQNSQWFLNYLRRDIANAEMKIKNTLININSIKKMAYKYNVELK